MAPALAYPADAGTVFLLDRTDYTRKRRSCKQSNMRYDTRRSSGKGSMITACRSDSGPFIRDALHVEMDTQNWVYNDDDEAARAAQRDGVKLIYGVQFVTDNIYIDTPENRKILIAYSGKVEGALCRRKRHPAGQATE